MIALYKEAADNCGMSFTFGPRGQFLFDVDKVDKWPLLYAEGYGEGELVVDDNGNLSREYNTTLWLLDREPFSSSTEQHAAQLEKLMTLGERIMKQLLKEATVQSRTAFLAIAKHPMADRHIDGVRLAIKIKPKKHTPVC